MKDIEDLAEIEKDMERLNTEYRSKIALAVARLIELHIHPISARQCPKDTGALRRSWVFDDPVVDSDRVLLAFGYGGNTGVEGVSRDGVSPRNYAVIQHERMHRKYTTPGTKWKYLEDPVMEKEGIVLELIWQDVDRIIGGVSIAY